MFNFSQLRQKCLFRTLVQTKPTHCIWLSCCIVEPRVTLGLSACCLLPTSSPAPSAWIALHSLLLGPELKGHSQALLIQPLTSVACASGTLGCRGHCPQLFPLGNQQVDFSTLKMTSPLSTLQGSQGVRGPQGVTGPKGTAVSAHPDRGQVPVSSAQAPRGSRLNSVAGPLALSPRDTPSFCALVFSAVNAVGESDHGKLAAI